MTYANTLVQGWKVAVVMSEPVDHTYCSVGELQALDDRGIRLTLIDWFTGAFTGFDFFIPWTNIIAIEVVTDEHDLKAWHPDKLQTRINKRQGFNK